MYEAGKGIKTAPSTPVAIYPPYYMQGMPAMVPIPPPSLIEPKMSTTPSIDNNISSAQQSLGKYFPHFTHKKLHIVVFPHFSHTQVLLCDYSNDDITTRALAKYTVMELLFPK